MSNALHIAGSLGESDFPDLLQWLADGRHTGTLLVNHAGGGRRVEKRIVLSRGRIIATASTEPKEYLGHFLVSNGFLDEEALAQAMDMQRRNRMLLGKILVTLGTISEADLEAMLRLKAEESVYEIFTWRGAAFEFLPGRVPELPMVPLSLEAAALVLEGARRSDEWRRIREAIPSPHCVPVSIGEVVLPPDDPAAARVLSLVDDDRTVEEITLQSHASEFVVGRVLTEQIERGRLKLVRPRFLGGPPPARAAAEPAAPDSALREALQHLKDGDLAAALQRLREVGDLGAADPETRLLAAEAENRIRAGLAAAGIEPPAVPVLAVELGQAAAYGLTAHEGFLMSRIDGRYSVDSIVKITPMAPLETEVALWKLLHQGLIRLAGRR